MPWKSLVVYLGSRFMEYRSTLAAVKHRVSCAESDVKRLGPLVVRKRVVVAHLKGHL